MTGRADLAGVVAGRSGVVSVPVLGAIAKPSEDPVTAGRTGMAGPASSLLVRRDAADVAAVLLGAGSVASSGAIAKTPDDLVAVGRAVREGALR